MPKLVRIGSYGQNQAENGGNATELGLTRPNRYWHKTLVVDYFPVLNHLGELGRLTAKVDQHSSRATAERQRRPEATPRSRPRLLVWRTQREPQEAAGLDGCRLY